MNRKALTRRKFLLLGGGATASVLISPAAASAGSKAKVSSFRMALNADQLRPTGIAAAAGSRGWYQTAPIKAQRRFDLLGLRHGLNHSTKLQIRSKRNGGSWSGWVPIGSGCSHAPDSGKTSGWSDPVWTGNADLLQIRSSKRLRKAEVQFINTTGATTLAGRIAHSMRSASVRARSTVSAEADQPTIISREEWGAAAYPPREDPSYGEINLAFVHHTVSSNDYSAEESASIVLGILQYHRNTKGWNDIGYNFLVDKYGQIFEGRSGGIDKAVIGAQAQGYNSVSTGIATIGDFTSTEFPEAGVDALVKLIAWKLDLHDAPATGTVEVESSGGSLNRYPAGKMVALNRISGHQDGDSTDCPGDTLYNQLPDIRERVAAIATGGNGSGSLSLSVKRTPNSYPLTFTASGKLKDTSGSAIAGGTVQLQRTGKNGYRKLAETTTNSAGEWSITAKVSSSTTVRAIYLDSNGATIKRSSSKSLKVKPLIVTRANRQKVRKGRSVTVSGKVQPGSASLLLIVERKTASGSYQKRGTQKLKVQDGEFSAKVTPRLKGTYRLSVYFSGNSKLAAVKATPLELKVI